MERVFDAASLSAALLMLLAAALLVAAATDIKARIIPNRLNLAVALAAPLWWWASGLNPWPDMAVQALVGVSVFAIFAALFALGMMGGGDVKLLGALALWLPLQPLAELLFLMAVAGGVVTLAAMLWHRLRRAEGRVEVPYGVAIAAAGLWVISARYLNHLI